jgi:hypothetical protein
MLASNMSIFTFNDSNDAGKFSEFFLFQIALMNDYSLFLGLIKGYNDLGN